MRKLIKFAQQPTGEDPSLIPVGEPQNWPTNIKLELIKEHPELKQFKTIFTLIEQNGPNGLATISVVGNTSIVFPVVMKNNKIFPLDLVFVNSQLVPYVPSVTKYIQPSASGDVAKIKSQPDFLMSVFRVPYFAQGYNITPNTIIKTASAIYDDIKNRSKKLLANILSHTKTAEKKERSFPGFVIERINEPGKYLLKIAEGGEIKQAEVTYAQLKRAGVEPPALGYEIYSVGTTEVKDLDTSLSKFAEEFKTVDEPSIGLIASGVKPISGVLFPKVVSLEGKKENYQIFTTNKGFIRDEALPIVPLEKVSENDLSLEPMFLKDASQNFYGVMTNFNGSFDGSITEPFEIMDKRYTGEGEIYTVQTDGLNTYDVKVTPYVKKLTKVAEDKVYVPVTTKFLPLERDTINFTRDIDLVKSAAKQLVYKDAGTIIYNPSEKLYDLSGAPFSALSIKTLHDLKESDVGAILAKLGLSSEDINTLIEKARETGSASFIVKKIYKQDQNEAESTSQIKIAGEEARMFIKYAEDVGLQEVAYSSIGALNGPNRELFRLEVKKEINKIGMELAKLLLLARMGAANISPASLKALLDFYIKIVQNV